MALVAIDLSTGSMRLHTFADSGNLWAFGHTQLGPLTPAVFKSTDAGATWHVQDSANATQHASNGGGPGVAGSGGIHFYYDAPNKKIWFAYFNIQTGGQFFIEFQTFDINTGLYSAPFAFGGGNNPNFATVGPEKLEDFVVLSDGTATVFYCNDPGTLGQPNISLYCAQWNVGTGWAPPFRISTNEPAGSINNAVRADLLGATSSGTIAYLFYMVAQVHQGDTGIPTYAIYYRSVDNTGSLGSITTFLSNQTYAGGPVQTERQGIITTVPGLDPNDPWIGVWHTSFLSFQNVYISGSIVKTYIDHGGKPAWLTGTPLGSPTFTITDIFSPVTALEEVNGVPADIAAWIFQTSGANDSFSDSTNSGSGWGAPALLYSNPTHHFNYIWPVGNNASVYDYLQQVPYYLASSGPVAPTCTLSSMVAGGSVTLTWTTANSPTSASIDQGIGAVNPAGGSLVIPLPLVTTTYTLTVMNAAGTSTCQTTVVITPPTPPIPAAPGVLEFVPFGGNGSFPGVAAGFGNVYTTPTDPSGAPILLTDDDYGQIFPYYTTYFFVNHEQEMALQLGAHRKMLSYFTALLNGTGNITIQALCNILTNAWPLSVTRALAAQAVSDTEWPGGSATAQRIAFKFASSPTTGTDNGFQLEKCVATLKPVTHLPVRGAL